jgi:lipoyl(octanoyl) transferase
VWLAADRDRPERKIAAIGVRVAAGTTMHGFAINVDPDLTAYATIIPCGLVGVGVTSMAAELGRSVPVPEVAAALLPQLTELLAFAPYTQSADLGLSPELSTAG